MKTINYKKISQIVFGILIMVGCLSLTAIGEVAYAATDNDATVRATVPTEVCAGSAFDITLSAQDLDGVVSLERTIKNGSGAVIFSDSSSCNKASSCSHIWTDTISNAGNYNVELKFVVINGSDGSNFTIPAKHSMTVKNCPTNDPATGEISFDPTSKETCLNNPIKIFLRGEDSDGVEELRIRVLKMDGNEEETLTYSCNNSVSCSNTFEITRNFAVKYRIIGKVFGKNANGGGEAYVIGETTPIYIEFKDCTTAPTVVTKNANRVCNSATLSGELTSTGQITPVEVYFDYGTTNGYGNKTASQYLNATGTFNSSISSLNSCTTYHYRAVAKNTKGTINGEDKTFTTNCGPSVEAGPNKDVLESQSIILEGSGSDPEGDSLSYVWSCTKGSLSSNSIAQPTFYAPLISGTQETVTCTITATDSCGANVSDTTTITVKRHGGPTVAVSLSANPNSGCAPLNDVDLTASVTGDATGDITYYFDCTNDGNWEKIYTSSNTSYTASNLCNYSASGSYTAKVRVQRQGVSAENTIQFSLQNCCTAPTVDLKINSSDNQVNVSYNASAVLSWTSSNANSCSASGGWSGTKATSGSESTGNLTSAHSYTITCSNSCGSAADTVTVYVQGQPYVAVNLTANPNSGCAPLNDVDLTASVTGDATGDITYYFDCTNDGNWEKIYTSSNTSYTASNLCNYTNYGVYTAKVKVERNGISSENTTQVNVSSCSSNNNLPTVDIKANNYDYSVTITPNSSAVLTWTSSNANSCYASNGWSGSKNLSGSETTELLTSAKTYTITCSNSYGSASDSVTVYVSQTITGVTFTVNKLVKNVSDNTQYANGVYADPDEIITFKIEVTPQTNVSNVMIKDDLPAKMIYIGNLKIDGNSRTEDIRNGINLGYFNAFQTKTITFDAKVSGTNEFAYGQTTLINNAVVSVQGQSGSITDSAEVIVKKVGVLGATTISTGLTNNILFDSLIIPLILAFIFVFIFKANLLKIEKWLDERKRQYNEYKSKKMFQLRVAKIKLNEFVNNKKS